jgi:hypothetical protein
MRPQPQKLATHIFSISNQRRFASSDKSRLEPAAFARQSAAIQEIISCLIGIVISGIQSL